MEKQKLNLNFGSNLSLIEQGKEVIKVYYDSIGQEFTPKDRHIIHSQPRIALGVALARRLGKSLTGEVLNKDRTTIHHYEKKHDAHLENWDGYALLYETAEYIVDSYFAGASKVNRIEYIDKTIKKLLKEKQSIQSQINEQLQIQDH